MQPTQIYIVMRDSADGPELDVFLDEANAEAWAEHIGAGVQVENTLDDRLADLIASREAYHPAPGAPSDPGHPDNPRSHY